MVLVRMHHGPERGRRRRRRDTTGTGKKCTELNQERGRPPNATFIPAQRVRTAEARGGGTSRSVKSGRQGPGRRSPKAAGFADSRWAGDRPFDTGRLDTGRAGLVKDAKRLARGPGGPAPARHFWSARTRVTPPHPSRLVTISVCACEFAVAYSQQPRCGATQVPIDRRLDKEVWYIRNGLLLGHKKEGDLAFCNNMDELRGHCAEWSKSDRDKYTTYSHLYCGFDCISLMPKGPESLSMHLASFSGISAPSRQNSIRDVSL
nr:PREDICTED: uncharacterized protein LOC109449346 [Rhinolophus sinicus]